MNLRDTIFQWQKIKNAGKKVGDKINITNLPRPPSILPHDKKVAEAEKEVVKGVQKDYITLHKQKLESMVDHSHYVLLRIRGVFPFDFFPDIVSIECHQINIVQKDFFFFKHIQSIPIRNVVDVMIQTAPFFASLHIVDRSFVENTVSVNYLHKKEALRARRIIQGLVLASKEGVDITKLNAQDLRDKVEELGKAQLAEE